MIKIFGSSIEEVCKIDGKDLKVLVSNVYDRKLQMFENSKPVATPAIEDIWDFCGYVFKVRYTLNG